MHLEWAASAGVDERAVVVGIDGRAATSEQPWWVGIDGRRRRASRGVSERATMGRCQRASIGAAVTGVGSARS
jgi:hypothetical protein